MKKTKLDSEHIFLQFLMMFLTLALLLIFSLFVKNILWFDNIETTIPLISGIVVISLSAVSFLKYRLKSKDRPFLLFAVFLFLLGFLTIFSTLSNSLSFSSQITIAAMLIPLLLLLLVFLLFKKNWYYSNLDFWIIFSLSLFLFSRIFFLQNLLEGETGFLEYSYLITLFGYLTLTVGLVNEVYEVKEGEKDAKKRKKK
jgi:hypothetical protein